MVRGGGPAGGGGKSMTLPFYGREEGPDDGGGTSQTLPFYEGRDGATLWPDPTLNLTWLRWNQIAPEQIVPYQPFMQSLSELNQERLRELQSMADLKNRRMMVDYDRGARVSEAMSDERKTDIEGISNIGNQSSLISFEYWNIGNPSILGS